jgi:hypothetical protein
MLEMADFGDMTKAAVCGTLVFADRKYAADQVDAKTGDHYRATRKVGP